MQTRSSPVQIVQKSVEKPQITFISLPVAFILPASLSSMGSCSLMSQKAEGSMMKLLISHLSVYVAKEEWISRIQPHKSADLHFIPPFCFIFRFLNTIPLGAYFKALYIIVRLRILHTTLLCVKCKLPHLNVLIRHGIIKLLGTWH